MLFCEIAHREKSAGGVVVKELLTVLALCVLKSASAVVGDYSFTGFEELSAGSALEVTKADDGRSGAVFWGGGGAGECGVIADYEEAVSVGSLNGGRRYLQVDTQDTLMRYANRLNNSWHDVVDVSQTEGVYFDSLVQFRGTDALPEYYASDSKLEVWLYKSDLDDGIYGRATNLVIRAGYFDSTDNQTVSTNYFADARGIDEGWHRLTIKMIPELGDWRTDYGFVGVVGFVVFVDGVVVTSTAEKGVPGSVLDSLNVTAGRWHSANALFPSLQNRGTGGAQEFSHIGFRGEGAADELLITGNAPSFAQDDVVFTLKWARGLEELTIDGHRVDNFVAGESGSTNIVVASSEYRVTAAVQSGYEFGAFTASGRVSCRDGVFSVSGSGVGTVEVEQMKYLVEECGAWVGYASFEAAMEAAVAGGTIRLGADVSECVCVREKDLVFDLAGHSVVYESSDDSAFYVDSESKLLVVDSAGGGRIVGGEAGSIYYDGSLTIGASSGDKGVIVDGGALTCGNGEMLVVKGRFRKSEYDLALLTDAKDPYTAIAAVGDYYVATPGEAPPPPVGRSGWDDAETAAEGARASEVWAAFPQVLAESDAKKLAAWAKASGVVFAAAETIDPEAFLLNCSNTVEAIEAAKAAFRFEAIEPGEIPTIDGDYNGRISVKGSNDLENWSDAEATDSFFKAELGF